MKKFLKMKKEKSEYRDYPSECREACLRLMDELEGKIAKEKDESTRRRMEAQLKAIQSFSYVDFGIPYEYQGNWLGFLYPTIDEKGTLHFTFCSRSSDLPAR